MKKSDLVDMVAKSSPFAACVHKFLQDVNTQTIALSSDRLYLQQEFLQIEDNLKLVEERFMLDAGPSFCHARIVKPVDEVPGVSSIVKLTHFVNLPPKVMREFLQNLDEKVKAYEVAANHLRV